MSRLYGISYDKEKWVIEGSYNTGYLITRKETCNSYSFGGNIIGIEQITDDAFLVYRRITRNAWSITRIKLTSAGKVIEYKHSFKNFDFLTEDTIIFDKDSSYSAIVYSISRNCEITKIESIISNSSKAPDAMFCESREIDLYYNSESSGYPLHLLVGYELPSRYCMEFIQVMIDPSTLQPISPAYSTLRNHYIPLSKDFSLKELFLEDIDRLKVIDEFIYKSYLTDTRKTETEFCADIEKL